MKINIKTKFDIGDLVCHLTLPGQIMLITGFIFLNNDYWLYKCSMVEGCEVVVQYFSEYELEPYDSKRGFTP